MGVTKVKRNTLHRENKSRSHWTKTSEMPNKDVKIKDRQTNKQT